MLQAEAVWAELLERSSMERGAGPPSGGVMLLRARCRGIATLCPRVGIEVVMSLQLSEQHTSCLEVSKVCVQCPSSILLLF